MYCACNYFADFSPLPILVLYRLSEGGSQKTNSMFNTVRSITNICCHNSNLVSKCGVKFICQQKSNICLFQQQTNLWQRFILASIYYYLQGKLFFFLFTISENLSTKYLAKLKRCLQSFKKSQHHDISTV